MFNGQAGNYTQSNLPSQLFNANGNVDYNGTTYNVSNHGNGTRDITVVGNTAQINAQNAYTQATDQAVSGLQSAGTSLDQQYQGLLQDVLGQGTVAMNTATTGENNLLAQRGITNNSPLYSQQMTQAQLPVTAQNQAAVGSLGYTEGQIQTGLAQNIASLQTGAAGTIAELPLSYGSLALSQAALPSQIAQANAQSLAANYISNGQGGIYNIAQQQGVTGLPGNGQVVQSNGQYFLSIP